MLYEANGRVTVTSVRLIETFYPLRADYDKLTYGIYLLNLTEAVVEQEEPQQELFMLLLHTLSRLTFYEQEPRPLMAGFLLHFAASQGFRPRLKHCACCGRAVGEAGPFFFDHEAGGICCPDCGKERKAEPVSREQAAWMNMALESGSAAWVNTPEMYAPFALLKHYVEGKLGRRFRSGKNI